jgi:serine/threonine protein kinase
MVVMGYMDSYETLSTLEDLAPISTQLRKMVTDLVTSFHDQKFVHGDIRDSNLLVRMEDGKLQMKLIDFDWGGREGEVRYPVLINDRTVHRPLGVVGGQLIKREHDLQMVENILSGLP